MKKFFGIILVLAVSVCSFAQTKHSATPTYGVTPSAGSIQTITEVNRYDGAGNGAIVTIQTGDYAGVSYQWVKTALNGAFAAGDRKQVFGFTASAASATLTATAHGLVVGDAISVATTTTLPAPLAVQTVYYVVSAPTANTFTISATAGGGAITMTTTGTGTHNAVQAGYWIPFVGQIPYASSVVSTTNNVATAYLITRVDSTSGTLHVLAPTTPNIGMTFGVKDEKGTAGTNNITIGFNTDKLEGFSGTGAAGQPNSYVINSIGGQLFQFVGGTRGWILYQRIY